MDLYITEKLGDFASAIILVYFYSKAMPLKNKKYIKAYVILMIILYSLIPQIRLNNIIYNIENEKAFIFIIIFYIISFIYSLFLKDGRISEKLFLSAFFFTIMLIISFVVYIFATNLFNVTFHDLLFETSYKRCITILVNRLIQFISVHVFLKNINFINYIDEKTLYVADIILILNQIAIFLIQRDTLRYSCRDSCGTNIYIIIKLFILCSVQVLAIYMLSIVSKQMEETFILKMNLNRKIHDEKIIEMYKEMNGWKHDFKNHISMILGLLEGSNKDDVLAYINEIDDSVSRLDRNIYTDNIAINSILASKMKDAESKKIKIKLNLKINSDIRISNVDLCIILGNLLDNSIQASIFLEEPRFIDLKIIAEENMFVIKISNRTDGKVNEVNGRFLSTKNNGMHGIGIIQVDNIVKKYNGYINRKHINNIFTTYMMIQY